MTKTKNSICKNSLLAVSVILLIIICNFSCSKTGNLGTDLISDDWIHAVGTEYHNIKFSALSEDSLVYANAGFPTTFFVGNVDDPIFGNVQGELYSQISFAVTKDVSFLKNKVDSIVLSMKYDTAAFYGDPNALQTIKVYPLIDTLYLNKTYYHNALQHRYSNDELGSIENFKPNLKDSVRFKVDTIEYGFPPQLRMRLDTAKFMGILRSLDDTVYNNLTLFSSKVPGIAIVSQTKGAVMAFQPTNSESRITIYYTVDNKKAQFNFLLGSMLVSNNRVDNTGSSVDGFMKNTTNGDSICFLQGFNGKSLRIQIPYDPEWQGKLVKYAVLELYSPEIPTDNTGYFKRPPYLLLKDLSTSKPYLNIIDARYALLPNNLTELARSFGGKLEKITLNGEEVSVYRCNITGHFINAKKAKKDIDILLSPLYKVQRADRLILGGNQHSKYSSRLKLVFSEQ